MSHTPPATNSAPATDAAQVKARRSRTGLSGTALARGMGWLAATGFVVLCGMLVLTWDHGDSPRSAVLRVASAEAPIANALSLKAGPEDVGKPSKKSGPKKPAASEAPAPNAPGNATPLAKPRPPAAPEAPAKLN